MGHLGPMWLSTVRDGQGGRIGPSNGSAPLTPLPLDAFWPPVLGGGQSSMLGRCEAVTLLVGGLFRRFLARSKAERPEKRILRPYRRLAKLFENYIILKYGTLKMGAPPDPKPCPVALFLKQVEKGQAGTHGVRARGGL